MVDRVADAGAEWVQKLTPTAYRTMTTSSIVAECCRLGHNRPPAERPFAACSFVIDDAIHSHVDTNDMHQGVTVVGVVQNCYILAENF